MILYYHSWRFFVVLWLTFLKELAFCMKYSFIFFQPSLPSGLFGSESDFNGWTLRCFPIRDHDFFLNIFCRAMNLILTKLARESTRRMLDRECFLYCRDFRLGPIFSQSLSQILRYPCPAERENEGYGSNHFEITGFCPSNLVPRVFIFPLPCACSEIWTFPEVTILGADQKERGLWGLE